jgi:putative transposase
MCLSGLNSAKPSSLTPFYWKPYFWHRAYYVGSVGGATLETVRRYVESQGTQEKPRKAQQPA